MREGADRAALTSAEADLSLWRQNSTSLQSSEISETNRISKQRPREDPISPKLSRLKIARFLKVQLETG